jgi:hypothetical protein
MKSPIAQRPIRQVPDVLENHILKPELNLFDRMLCIHKHTEVK